MAQRRDSDDGNPVREGPHTVPVVGIEADVRPIGKNGGERTSDTGNECGRAYGEAGTSVSRERGWSE